MLEFSSFCQENRSMSTGHSKSQHGKTLSKYFNGQLYNRMSEDLHLAVMSPRTHDGYLRTVRQLSDFSKRSPDKITEEQMRCFFLHLKNERNFACGSLRVAFSGVKFCYIRTCRRNWQSLAFMKLQNVKSLPEASSRSAPASVAFFSASSS